MEATSFQDLIDDERIPVNYLAEIEPCQVVTGWTEGSNHIYSVSFPILFPRGIVSRIYIEGVVLAAQTTLAALSSASGWFHDYDAGLLYVRLAGDGDPDVSETQVYFWLCFAKNEVKLWFTDDVYQYYEPLLKSIPGIGRTAPDTIFAAEEVSGGSIVFKNGAGKDYGDKGAFDDIFHDYIWTNKTIRIKAGGSNLDYDEYVTVFVGRLSKPQMNDTDVTFTISSMLSLLDKKVPVETFTADAASTVPFHSYYEHLEPSAEGKPIPLLLGVCLNVKPTQIDTTNWTFKVGRRFKTLLSIRAGGVEVYKDGDDTGGVSDQVESITPEYGQFKMNLWASSNQLTVDVEGETADDEITVLTKYGQQARFLMENAYAGDIDASNIDTAAFDTMNTSCPQEMSIVVSSVRKITDILSDMDASVCAQHGVDEDGKITARAWDATLDTGDAVFFDETDIHDLNFSIEDSRLYQKIKLGYAKNNCVQPETLYKADTDPPPADVQQDWSFDFLYAEDEDAGTKNLYDNEEVLPLNTLLSTKDDAVATLAAYKPLLIRPWVVVTFNVHLQGFTLKIGDTVHLTHYRLPTGDSGYFKVIGVVANRNSSKAEIKAFKVKS